MNSGWRCPGCGKCYSPLTPQCFTCGQPTTTGTSTASWLNMGKDKVNVVPKNCNHPKNCEANASGYCGRCHSEYY